MDTTQDSDLRPPRSDRPAILVILGIGMFAGGFVAGLGLINAIFRLVDPSQFAITLLANTPIDAGAGVSSAQYEQMSVMADSLSAGAVWLIAGAEMFTALTIGLVTASFSYALWRIVSGQPFHRTMRVAAIVAGCSIVFGTLLSQGLGGLGQMMAATELEDALGGAAVAGFEISPLPIVVGFGILALSYVFHAGTRMQRDTEGLI